MTGLGLASLVMFTSARATTAVASVAVLLALFDSSASLETSAVLVMVVPSGVPALTWTTMVNDAAAPPAKEVFVAVKVPVPPPAGMVSVNVGPEV